MNTVSVKRLGSNGDSLASFNLKISDFNCQRISLLFKLVEESIFLTSELTNEVIFPNNNVFEINPIDEYYVNGSPIKSKITPLNNITNGITLNTRGLPAPINKVVSGFGSAASSSSSSLSATSSQRFNTQTKKKELTWRKTIPEMVFVNNRLSAKRSHPLQLNERTANVTDVLDIMRNNLNDPVLIDSYHLEISESGLTKGSSYWKGSRKIMAIERETFNTFNAFNSESKATRGSRNKRRHINDDGSDDNDDDDDNDNDEDISYSPIISSPKQSINSLNNKLVEISNSILQLENKLCKKETPPTNHINFNKIVNVMNSVTAHFNCIICLDLVKDENPKVTMCCSSVTCFDCLSRWKTTNDSCPHCRSSSPIPIPMQLKGVVEIVQALKSLKNETVVSPNESLADVV